MMQAVILAAGLGSRIRDFHALPKGFIRIGDQPIIQESIRKLNQYGVNDILIVTGYAANHYDAFAKDKKMTTCFNPHYHCYGSLFSLYCARDWIKNDFLVLESDIIYESSAIDSVLNDPHRTIILLSGTTQSGDEVYVEAKNKNLIRMSKQKDQLNEDHIYGEFVGINKLSFKGYQQLIQHLEKNTELLQKGHYEEQGIVAMTAFTDVFCLKKSDLLWCEIDHYLQFEKAKKVYEKIKNKGDVYA